MADTENDKLPPGLRKALGVSSDGRVVGLNREVQATPELPDDVAQQYGLHDDRQGDVASTSPPATSTIEDAETDAAVDDIVRKESDALLDIQPGYKPPTAPAHKPGHARRFFRTWWRNKWARWITVSILIAALGTVVSIQNLRYAALNAIGVRSTASVVILDDTTKLPLKNVSVFLDDTKVLTDIEGRAKFYDVKLGKHNLTIKRVAFASHRQQITVGWGSNPLGEFKLKATGVQYVLTLTDYLSNQPIEGAEVTERGYNALSDASGKVVLTLEGMSLATLAVSIQAKGYRPESLELDANSAAAARVTLVPAQKEIFVSKQNGKYDIYSIDLDGKNRRLLLAGTGAETANLALVVSPDGERAAFVSTRDSMRDSDGYLLSALTIINVKQGTAVTVDHAEQIQLVDWLDNRLIYRSTIAGTSAANPQRSRLISLNYETNSRAQLATANQFNTIISAQDHIYYGVSSNDPEATLGLFRISPDGSGRKRLSDNEVWTGLRQTYNTLSLQTPEGWQTYSIDDEKFTRTDAPSNLTPYVYTNNPSGSQSAWTDIRDGKGTLLIYDIEKGTHKTLKSQEGLTTPLRWVNDWVVMYRVSSPAETASYAISLAGGGARKVTDITPVYGYTQTY